MKIAVIAQLLSNIVSLMLIFMAGREETRQVFVSSQLIVSYLSLIGFSHFGLIDGQYQRLIEGVDREIYFNLIKRYVFVVGFTIAACLILLYFKRQVNYSLVLLVIISAVMVNTQAFFYSMVNGLGRSEVYFKALIVEKVFSLIFLVCIILGLIKDENWALTWIPLSGFINLIALYAIKKANKIEIPRVIKEIGIIQDVKKGVGIMISNITYTAPIALTALISSQLIESKDDLTMQLLAISISSTLVSYFVQLSLVVISNSQKKMDCEFCENIRSRFNIKVLLMLFIMLPFVMLNLFESNSGLNYLIFTLVMLAPYVIAESYNNLCILPAIKVKGEVKRIMRVNLLCFLLYIFVCCLWVLGMDNYHYGLVGAISIASIARIQMLKNGYFA